MIERVPTLLVAGGRAGRIAAVASLLDQQPPDERWALLADGLPDRFPRAVVRPAPRACPCCTGRMELRVTLTRLLREARPHRLLLEFPASVHLDGIVAALRADPLARALDLRAVVGIVDMGHPMPDPQAPLLRLADLLAGYGASADAPDRLLALARCAPARRVEFLRNGRLDLAAVGWGPPAQAGPV